jgi:hypothetical protein
MTRLLWEGHRKPSDAARQSWKCPARRYAAFVTIQVRKSSLTAGVRHE